MKIFSYAFLAISIIFFYFVAIEFHQHLFKKSLALKKNAIPQKNKEIHNSIEVLNLALNVLFPKNSIQRRITEISQSIIYIEDMFLNEKTLDYPKNIIQRQKVHIPQNLKNPVNSFRKINTYKFSKEQLCI